MGKPRAPFIDKHAWPVLVMAALASGIAAQAFGRQHGLTSDQSRTLRKKMDAEIARQHEQGIGINLPEDSSSNLIQIQHRLAKAMQVSAERCAALLEHFNASYAPTVDKESGKLIQPIPAGADLTAWKWAWTVGANVLRITKGHNAPAGDSMPAVPEIGTPAPRGLIRRQARVIEMEG